ncbi:MAG: hypothetical protein Q6370_002195 [Candidatus Sigynarchaeota archaeon]
MPGQDGDGGDLERREGAGGLGEVPGGKQAAFEAIDRARARREGDRRVARAVLVLRCDDQALV